MIEQVLLAAASAATYSVVFYAKSRSGNPEDEFKPYKLGATVLVGVVVGVGYSLSGTDFSQQDISTQIAVYSGTVALVESILKAAWRQYMSNLLDA